MKTVNNAVRLKRELLIRLVRSVFDGNLLDQVDRIPLEMTQKQETLRCCKYRDRAILKYRIMADLGFSIEEETDELAPLNEYAYEALKRIEKKGKAYKGGKDPILTVVGEACSACHGGYYHVSGICRGCVARPCQGSCPTGAIRIENGQSIIDEKKCIKCGKCQAVCPYSAIIRVPVPCEEACPVGAISKDESGREKIDFDQCIYCGKCVKACPFGAVMEKSRIVDVAAGLKAKSNMTALVAPSIEGQFPGSREMIHQGLLDLGFNKVVEAAWGADLVTEKEGAELLDRLEEGKPLMTTSCCPAYVRAARKHIPEIRPFVSDTPSPMVEAARRLKEKETRSRIVFIGPCTAKRSEAAESDSVDEVLSFEELGALFIAAEIDIAELADAEFENPASANGIGFAVGGGVAESVLKRLGYPEEVKADRIDGIDQKGIKLLKAHAQGKLKKNFLEVMACEGGCVNGPGVVCDPRISTRAVRRAVEETSLQKKKNAG